VSTKRIAVVRGVAAQPFDGGKTGVLAADASEHILLLPFKAFEFGARCPTKNDFSSADTDVPASAGLIRERR
jgi:hypothetical protein